MCLKNTPTSYGIVTKSLHWLIFFLVATLLVVGFFMGDIKDEALKGQVFNVHKLVGITVLLLMILRAVWTLMNPKPDLPAGTPAWQKKLEHLVHFLIYAALIAMPLSGWVFSTAAGYAPHLGSIQLAFPVSENKALSDTVGNVHYYLAWFIICLVSLHVLAALYHFLIKKDGILERMLPGS